MARFGILCPPVPGHMNPMIALARELNSRGHSAIFIGFADMRGELPDELDFAAVAEKLVPSGGLKAFSERISQMEGIPGIRGFMVDIARFAEAMFRDLPRVLEQVRPDVLVIDQAEPAPCMVARSMGIPYANIANALPLNIEPAIPPPMAPWDYDPSPNAIQRNLAAYRMLMFIRQPITQVLRRNAQRLGQRFVCHPDEVWSGVCQISQCVRALDFPRKRLPQGFHYVGPMRELDPPLSFELPDDGRPLIFCSLGSLQGSRAEIFHSVCCAAEELGVNLLIAHGGRLSDAQAAALPGNPIVKAFVPQRTVLSKCALAVTHAGFNTVMDSLSCGTPMVALPIAFEQPGIGARVRRAGAGEVLFDERTPSLIAQAMQRVFSDDSYRKNAARLAQEITQAGGVKRAADLLEQAFGARVRRRKAASAPT